MIRLREKVPCKRQGHGTKCNERPKVAATVSHDSRPWLKTASAKQRDSHKIVWYTCSSPQLREFKSPTSGVQVPNFGSSSPQLREFKSPISGVQNSTEIQQFSLEVPNFGSSSPQLRESSPQAGESTPRSPEVGDLSMCTRQSCGCHVALRLPS